MITYNHESYIAQAIEGFLIQKTNFPVRLVIGEDGSTDKTRAICMEYQSKFPDSIILLPDVGNLGMNPNFIRTLKACTAKYVALCEGDDYWTDPDKLQKQVDIMEANTDLAICFHRMQVSYDDDASKNYITNVNQKELTTIEDLALGNYIFTASCLYKNNLFEDFPKSFESSPVGDYFLHLLNAQYGKIWFINENFGVYRIHSGGVWESKPVVYRAHKWLLVQQFLINELKDFPQKNLKDSLVKNLKSLYEIYCFGTNEEKQYINTNCQGFINNILELYKINETLNKELIKQKVINDNNIKLLFIAKNQINSDFNSPFKSFVRNIYYRFINKKIKVIDQLN